MDKPVPAHRPLKENDVVILTTRDRRSIGIVTGECECGCREVYVFWDVTSHESRVRQEWLELVDQS